MPLQRLQAARQRMVGTKQSLKAVEKGQAKAVYIARDADPHVIDPLMKLCEQKQVPVIMVDSMEMLGRLCAIKVGAASAAITAE
ncbi:MAG: ribosomal L7Ae/L30e/S12e/Gadd45 family protein [Heliobacteriaceae bacterium]|nr:ribosomal L7Ae/L30e/S12e/Gadd45 family protein [Heliobacteriaceae bacterium]MDD4587856.1 ribosomal L7Ae/L30e/S12e/Gadd45 family protein [Heliobacteriaceae bacterium]